MLVSMTTSSIFAQDVPEREKSARLWDFVQWHLPHLLNFILAPVSDGQTTAEKLPALRPTSAFVANCWSWNSQWHALASCWC
jgi:hypothetical protein